MNMSGSMSRRMTRRIANALNDLSVSSGGTGLAGELTVSDSTPQEGDTITFEWLNTGPIVGDFSVSDFTPQEGDTITFKVDMGFSYQLKKDGVDVSGATTNPYSKVAAVGDDGDYTMVVTNSITGQTKTFGPVNVVVSPNTAQEKTYVLYDNFNGTAGALIGRTATRGGTWEALSASLFSGIVEIDGSGSAVQPTGALSNVMVSTETPPNDNVVTIDMTLGGNWLALWSRATGTGGDADGYFLLAQSGATVKLNRRVSGTSVQLAESGSTFSGAIKLEIRCVGSTIIGLVDGVQVLSATDSTFTSGKVGFSLNGSGVSVQRFCASGVAPISGVRTFLIAGQSNAVGLGDNNQEWSSTTHVAWLYGNDDRWRVLTDPYDYAGGEVGTVAADAIAAGSWIPKFCTDMMSKYQSDIAIVPSAHSATAISQWQPGASHTDRATLYGNAAVRGNAAKATTGRLDRVLWYQGETDAINAVSASTYQASLEALADAFFADTGAKLRACLLHNSTSITDADENAIRTGVTQAVANNNNVLLGPDLSDIASDDGYHPKTDVKLTLAGQRWAATE